MNDSKSYIGFLDNVLSETISGWAKASVDSSPVEVTPWINDKLIEKQNSTQFRKGILKKKIHSTGKCGFVFEDIKLAENDNVRCTFPNGVDLKNSPWKITSLYNHSKKKLFFMHIAKTAGTSLNSYIEKHFDSDRVKTHLEGVRFGETKFDISKYSFMSGHLRILRMQSILDLSDFKKITLLREPISHLASHLKWVRHIGKSTTGNFFRSHSLEIQSLSIRLNNMDFENAEELNSFFSNMNQTSLNLFNNCQSRYFLNDIISCPLNEKHLNTAIKTLDQFNLIGTLEEYDLFVNSVSKLMSWPEGTPPSKKNVNKENYGLDINNPEIFSILSKQVEYDILLYENVKRYGLIQR